MLFARLVTTLLIAAGVIWLGASLLFVVGLCLAAAKPVPAPAHEREYVEPAVHSEMETAVCAR
jgi:hypothetical protein